MAKLKLSKSALTHQRRQLSLYKRALPSLDLKRRQLSAELAKARHALATAETAYAALQEVLGCRYPMIAEETLDLERLCTIEDCVIGEENLVGVRVPRLDELRFQSQTVPLLSSPPWLDLLIVDLQRAARVEIELAIARQRCAVIAQAQRRITQRVNLFENVLIPQAERNIKRIRIYLGDAERDAVVRSKLAKQRLVAGVA